MTLDEALATAQKAANVRQHPIYVLNSCYPYDLDGVRTTDGSVAYYLSYSRQPTRDQYTVVPE